MAEKEDAGRAEAAQEELEDLEAPDADVKGGDGTSSGTATNPRDVNN